MRLVRAAVVGLLMVIGSSPTRAAQSTSARPSFDCAKTTDVIEQTICGDQKLAQADSVMARLFAAARFSAFGEGPSSELALQRKWLKDRVDCLDFKKRMIYESRAHCLARHYEFRNHDLAVAALFTEPELALTTLRQLDPEVAPLYEAIADYVTGAGRQHIEQLVEPYFTRFRSGSDMSYLSNNGINAPADAVKSEENFVEFLQVASAFLQTGDPRGFPCAAIVRRPGLLGAEDSYFGGAIDNAIFRSDCSETLPPLPKLDALVKAINHSWPTCEGISRFQIYRTFELDVDRARLGIDGVADKGEVPRPKGVAAGLITAAINELSHYYAMFHRVAHGSPSALAMQNVRVILADGDECE